MVFYESFVLGKTFAEGSAPALSRFDFGPRIGLFCGIKCLFRFARLWFSFCYISTIRFFIAPVVSDADLCFRGPFFETSSPSDLSFVDSRILFDDCFCGLECAGCGSGATLV